MCYYSREVDATKVLLDKLDLKEYLQPGFSVNDIQSAIQDDYEYCLFPSYINAEIEKNPFEGYIFNVMSQDEFMTYIQERYGVHWIEETRYYLK